MKVNSAVQAPPQPVKQRPPVRHEQAQVQKPPEKQPNPPKAEGHLGRKLDVKA